MSLAPNDRAAPLLDRHPAWRALLRVRRHFWFKCAAATAFTSLFFVAYFHLLKSPVGQVRLMPVTALDSWIGFAPWVLPTNIDWAHYPGMAFLKGIDAVGNAFPSLHVATAVFAGFWLHQMARRLDLGRRFRQFNIAWCVAICYSTVATGQHVVVDVAGGVLLGGVMAWLTYPGHQPSSIAAHPRTAFPLTPP